MAAWSTVIVSSGHVGLIQNPEVILTRIDVGLQHQSACLQMNYSNAKKRTQVFSSFPKIFVLTDYLSENVLNHHGFISVFSALLFSLSLGQLSHWSFVLKQVCSPAGRQNIFQRRWVSPAWTKLLLVYHDLMGSVNKTRRLQRGARGCSLWAAFTKSQKNSESKRWQSERAPQF